MAVDRSGRGTSELIVEIQGLNVLSEHFAGFAQAFGDFAPQIIDVCADIGVEEAKAEIGHRGDIRFKNRTTDTRNSLSKEPVRFRQGEWLVEYGPETFYAPFLEWGTFRNRPYPFMIPSADLVEAIFFPSVVEFIKLFTDDGGGIGTGMGGPGGRALADPRIRGNFTQARSFLYSTSKFLGDISVFGGRDIFSPIRSLSLTLAKTLGDVNSVMTGAIGTRVSHRLTGRVTGKIIGFGSASLSHSRTYSAFPGGSGGHRIYQRIAGSSGLGSSLSSVSGMLSGIRG